MRQTEIKLIPFFGSQLYQKYNLGLLRILIVGYYLIILASIIGLSYGIYKWNEKKSNYENGQYKVTKYSDISNISFRDSLREMAKKDIEDSQQDLFYASIGISTILLLYWVIWYLLGWIFSGFFVKKTE